MNRIDIGPSVIPKRNAPLIAHHNHPPSRPIQSRNRRLCSRQKFNIAPLSNVFPFRRLAIDNAISIEKDIPNIMKASLHRLASEPRVTTDMR
jgi:hypothetical protein